jgi:hypothetical protein
MKNNSCIPRFIVLIILLEVSFLNLRRIRMKRITSLTLIFITLVFLSTTAYSKESTIRLIGYDKDKKEEINIPVKSKRFKKRFAKILNLYHSEALSGLSKVDSTIKTEKKPWSLSRLVLGMTIVAGFDAIFFKALIIPTMRLVYVRR